MLYIISYLDPGTGSFLIQILVSGFLGILFAARLFRDQIRVAFNKLTGRSTPETPQTTQNENQEQQHGANE